MLARVQRMRAPAEFRETSRRGSRNGTRSVIVHVLRIPAGEPTRVGFVVSKAVGNAVVRNLVKRRLREIVAHLLPQLQAPVHIVVRAKPAAAGCTFPHLTHDVESALHRAGVLGS